MTIFVIQDFPNPVRISNCAGNNCPFNICPFNICPGYICPGNISPSSYFFGTTNRVSNFIFGQCGLGNEMSYKGNNEYFTQKCELNADFLDPKCVHTEIIQRVKDLILFLYTHTRLSVVRKASFFFFLLSLSSCSIATLFFGTWTATAPPLCLTPRCE